MSPALTGRLKDLVNPLNNSRLEYGAPWYGEFARDITDLRNGAFVYIMDFSDEHMWGPCPWQARDQVSLPSAGDPCIVVFDNRRNPWVIAWWPFAN